MHYFLGVFFTGQLLTIKPCITRSLYFLNALLLLSSHLLFVFTLRGANENTHMQKNNTTKDKNNARDFSLAHPQTVCCFLCFMCLTFCGNLSTRNLHMHMSILRVRRKQEARPSWLTVSGGPHPQMTPPHCLCLLFLVMLCEYAFP